MKKAKNIKIAIVGIFVITFIISCSVGKNKFYTYTGTVEDAIILAVNDFSKTYKTQRYYLKERGGKPFNSFRVSVLDENGLFVIGISPNTRDLSLFLEHQIGKVPSDSMSFFPNKYIEMDNKLFYWKDNYTPLNKNVIEVLDSYNILDSTDIKLQLGMLPDDFEDTRVVTTGSKLKGVDYYFCKKQPNKFKKVLTNIAYGYYEPPKIKCP